MNDGFEKSRKIFKEIKNKLEDEKYSEQRKEFEIAIKNLITQYDTANWENRFVVGGALEVLFCALINSIGFKCVWLKETRYDIKINEVKFSLKSNFTGTGDIRLINILGDERVTWNEPTLFFISGAGIYYADPLMNLSTKHTNDALVINIDEIKKLNKEWHISIKIERKPKNSGKIKTASYDVAKVILEEIQSKYLITHLPSPFGKNTTSLSSWWKK